jgi:sigma-B regulation protein RsbQ
MVIGNPDRPDLESELNTSFCSTDPLIARQFARATFLGDNRADLAQLSVPALVLQCSQDAIAPQGVGEYVARMVPESTFHQLRATGHCPHLSHPAETITAIREYLKMAATA